MAPGVAGTWRIVEMDLRDRDSIDLVGPAFIEVTADGGARSGSSRWKDPSTLGTSTSTVAERWSSPGTASTMRDHVSGRGWACLEADGSLRGHLFIHSGDDSGFRARSRSAYPSKRGSAQRGVSRDFDEREARDLRRAQLTRQRERDRVLKRLDEGVS